MHLLIPYIPIYDHEDPALEEFTYGQSGPRARKLKNDLKKGDYVFFHTSIKEKRYITAYYVVDRVLDTSEAVKNRNILLKYKNPHLREYLQGKHREEEDVIIFGDPILSKKLERPLLFDRKLAEKLSLSIHFRKGFTENQCIASATRGWRELNENDVKTLLQDIKQNERKSIPPDVILSTDEVIEINEKDLENFLEANPKILGRSLKLIKKQYDTPVGRIDMIFEDKDGTKMIVELKLNKIGRDAINQLRRYMKYIEETTNKEVRGILVCKGIMPAFEEEFKNLKNIKIFKYGWKLEVTSV